MLPGSKHFNALLLLFPWSIMISMLDIKFIRENADTVKDAAKKKNIDPGIIDELLEVDKARRELMQSTESIRAEQKKAKDRESGAALKAKFKEEEEKLMPAEQRFNELM